MSLITALLKRGRKRQQPDNDITDEPSNWWHQWGRDAGLRFGFLFGRQSAPVHGNQHALGIVAGNIGSNGHEAVNANEDDGTNNQLQLDDVNAHDEGGDNRADSNGAAVAAMADRDNQRTIPPAPRKKKARLGGSHDDENHVHRPFTSEGNFCWSDGVGVRNEINNDAFNQSLDRYTETLAITDGSSDDDRSDSESSSSSSGVGSSDSSDSSESSDSSDSSDDESADDTTAVVEDEDITTRCEEEEEDKYTHQFYESEQPLNGVAAIQQDGDDEKDDDEEEENEADTIEEDDITEQQSNEEEVTTNNDRQVVIITRHTPLLPANLNLNGHPRGIIFDGGLEAPSSEDDDEEEEDAMHIESVQQQQQSAETDDEALAHALQHHYDNEQTQMAEDAALALALQNQYSPHARESDSSTDPSRTFEFTRRSSDLGSSDVDAMDTEVHQEGIESEMDDDVDEEAETAAAEAAVDLEMEVFEVRVRVRVRVRVVDLFVSYS